MVRKMVDEALASLVIVLAHLVYTGMYMPQIFIKGAAVALAAAVVSVTLLFTHLESIRERYTVCLTNERK